MHSTLSGTYALRFAMCLRPCAHLHTSHLPNSPEATMRTSSLKRWTAVGTPRCIFLSLRIPTRRLFFFPDSPSGAMPHPSWPSGLYVWVYFSSCGTTHFVTQHPSSPRLDSSLLDRSPTDLDPHTNTTLPSRRGHGQSVSCYIPTFNRPLFLFQAHCIQPLLSC